MGDLSNGNSSCKNLRMSFEAVEGYMSHTATPTVSPGGGEAYSMIFTASACLEN